MNVIFRDKETNGLEKHHSNKNNLKEEFIALCKPLNHWLQKNFNPHVKIIIENDRAEIVEGIIGFQNIQRFY